jgi:hypothetical protein
MHLPSYIELMDKTRLLLATAFFAALHGYAGAQGFSADYNLAKPASPELQFRVAPAFAIGGEALGAGLQLQSNRNWFGQVGLSQAQLNMVTPGTTDTLNVGGGYRFGDGQSLSLQVSKARGPLPRLGLAVSYDWPRYFVRFSYDQGLSLTPQDNLRLSAGVRF